MMTLPSTPQDGIKLSESSNICRVMRALGDVQSPDPSKRTLKQWGRGHVECVKHVESGFIRSSCPVGDNVVVSWTL